MNDLINKVKMGDLRGVKKLLRQKHDVNQKNFKGITPLTQAARLDFYSPGKKTYLPSNSYKITQALIKAGADVNIKGGILQRTALHGFCEHEEAAKTVALLIKNGANVNAADIDGRRPLHLAVRWGNFKITRLLVENGVNVNAVVNSGASAFKIAQMNKHDSIAHYIKINGGK